MNDDTYRERRFPTGYGALRGLEFGRGEGARVLAIHGWLDNAASFIPLGKRLRGARLVALDLAGHGRSDHRARGAGYHLVDYLPDVVEAADHLGWERFHLLGHSLGAGLCCLLGAAFPERVSSLCLIDGLGPVSGEDRDAARRLRRAVRARIRPSDDEPRVYRSIDDAVQSRLEATPMLAASARLIVERNLRAVERGFAWRTDRRLKLASPLYLSESLVRAFLEAIACPVTLVRAGGGILHGSATAGERIRCVSRIDVVDAPGNHHLHMDDPERVAAIVERALGDP